MTQRVLSQKIITLELTACDFLQIRKRNKIVTFFNSNIHLVEKGLVIIMFLFSEKNSITFFKSLRNPFHILRI